jgi:hypothetical protein
VISFLKTPLIPLFFHTLDSTISIGNISSDEDIENIQEYICDCFLDVFFIVMQIDSLLNIIEIYINEIKKKK